jgi:hypothetical protein
MHRTLTSVMKCDAGDLVNAAICCALDLEELLGDRMPTEIMEELREVLEELSRRERNGSLQIT